MFALARRLSVVTLGVSAVLGLGSAAQAQPIPIGAAPNPGIGPVRGLAGLATEATLGRNLIGPAFGTGARLGFGSGALTGLGYGSLAASYARSPLGYASLLNGSGAGGYGPAGGYIGLGYGAIGAYYSGMNTAGLYSGLSGGYRGYLTGAAMLTTANAQYQSIIQQARLSREEATRSHYQTRRAMIEQAEYERAHMPDPEKIRQDQLRRALDRARVSPPLTEIWSGDALNTLLRHLISQQGQGVRGPDVRLNEDALKTVNFTPGDSRANAGLLRDPAGLQWPQPLQAEIFKEPREDLNRRLKEAVRTVSSGNAAADPAAINDLDNDVKKLRAMLDANVSLISLTESIEARRYLNQLANAVAALKDRNASNYLNGNWSIHARNVAELVKQMADKGLWFAAATPGDASSYLSLYHSLAAFDAGMSRISGTSGGVPPGGPAAGDNNR